MTTTTPTTEQYMDAVCAAGRAVLEGADAAAALAELARLEQQADCFLPAAHLRRAWALTGAEAQLLYACIACLADGLPLPGRAQAAGLLARCGQAPWQGAAGLFAPGADGGCLHPVAVDFLLQRAPRLGTGARLVLCEARPCYHSAPVLAQMEAFLAGLFLGMVSLVAAIRQKKPSLLGKTVLCCAPNAVYLAMLLIMG